MTSRARRTRRVLVGVIAAAVFVFTFFFRFNNPGGSFAGLTDDHFFYLVRGWQILFGDLPVRDFVDHGAPLFYYVGAAVQLLFGRGTLSEIAFCVLVLAACSAAVFSLAERASGSMLAALAGVAFLVLLQPRFYNYPKILVYVLGIPALWAFVDRPGARARTWLAALTVVAFLFRHDHGAFMALAFAALLLMMPTIPWRMRLRHAVIYGALVAALLAPYVLFIQANGGLTSYLHDASAWVERERNRTPVIWPGLFDNPEGVSDEARTAGGLRRAVAVVHDNQIAWLYYFELALPFAALLLIAAAPAAFRPQWPHARTKIAIVAVLGVVLNAGFLRSPLAARLADPTVPHAILIAWLCVAAMQLMRSGAALATPLRRPAVALAARTVGCAAVVGLLVIGYVSLTRDLYDWLDAAKLAEGRWSRAMEGADSTVKALSLTWPLERWIDPDDASPMKLAFYLRDCTKPSDRIFMQHYLPQVLALSQRAFAGGHADLRPGFFTAEEAQRRTVRRLQRQSVPVVLLSAGDEYRNFRRSFPLISAYLDEHYESAGERDIDGRFRIHLLVEKSAHATRRYERLDWPCFA